MGILDLLGKYDGQSDDPPPHLMDDFDRVAQEADPDEIGAGLEDAFRSDRTPPFEQMVAQLYDQSDDDTRAGLLNELAGSFGAGGYGGQQLGQGMATQQFGGGGLGGLAGGLGGGLLGGVLGGLLRNAGGRISPQDARGVPAREIEVAAAEAARRNPSLIERVSRMYARNPRLVQTLGQAAIAIAMNGMARRRRM